MKSNRNTLFQLNKNDVESLLSRANAQDAEKLLGFVRQANYVEAHQLAKKNPASIFTEVDATTPLKEAFRLLDTYMWDKLFRIIKHEPVYVDEFQTQSQEQKDYIDLEPLFMVYEKFLSVRNSPDNDIAEDKMWDNLAKAQSKYLPAHMLKEIGRYGNTWRGFEYSADRYPSPKSGLVLRHKFNYAKGFHEDEIALLPYSPENGTLFRGDGDRLQCSLISGYGNEVKIDLQRFIELYKTRKIEFDNRAQKITELLSEPEEASRFYVLNRV